MGALPWRAVAQLSTKTMKSLEMGQGISLFWVTWDHVANHAVACRDTKPLNSLGRVMEIVKGFAHVAYRASRGAKFEKKP